MQKRETREARRRLAEHVLKTAYLEAPLIINVQLIIAESRAQEKYVSRNVRRKHESSRPADPAPSQEGQKGRK
jgi:hypothetical protein